MKPRPAAAPPDNQHQCRRPGCRNVGKPLALGASTGLRYLGILALWLTLTRQKRPISPRLIEELVEKIVDEVTDKYEREIPCGVIGERVMAGLRELDDVAYVRFASVYRRFQEATEFVQEVKKLEAES